MPSPSRPPPLAWPPLMARLPASPLTLLGSADQFAVVGAVVPVALSIAALRKARLPLTIPQQVRRAASALHGESDWLPIAAAKLWFNKGGIIIGEAYRPDLKPKD